MNPQRKIPLSRLVSRAALVAVLVGAGCDLDVQNPNAPDAPRAFSDPAGLEQLLGGAFRTWVATRADYFIMPPNAQADNYSASWNNAALRFYSSAGVECPSRCGWTNSATAPEAAGGAATESQWYGYYTILSSANDVLRAIAEGLCFDEDCTVDNTLTERNAATAKMLQGMAFAGLAMFYDQAFVLDETSDLSDPTALAFSPREEVRDAAIQKFQEAYDGAGSSGPWETPSEWMGVGAGTSYSSSQIQQVIRTMQAEALAMYARDAAENAQTAWGQVATYASQGISNPAPGFEFQFYIDASGRECGLDCIKTWGNSIGTMRVDTRVASMLATNHLHPWPEPDGNPCPLAAGIYGVDARVGDGSFGPTDDFNGYATTAATANAGTDFACSGVVIFPPARGQYHQSNLQHIRYERLAYRGENLPSSDGTGQDPLYTAQMNDLMWAEGLIRSGGSKATAAQLINNSRVGRGGLPALTGAETDADLLAALQYEQEIEFMGQGSTPFFNRRRIDGLNGGAPNAYTGTPRQMPVPAKELEVLVREIYTFGGPGCAEGPNCQASVVATGGARSDFVRLRSVGEIWADYQAQARQASRTKQ